MMGTADEHRLNEAADVKRASSRAIAGVGRVLIWNGGSLWIGREAGRSDTHAHHAIQISLALTGEVRFRSASRGAWRAYTAALIPPHHPHLFDGGGQSVAQLFVEPETSQGRALLATRSRDAIASLSAPEVDAAVEALRAAYGARASNEALTKAGQLAIARLSGHVDALAVDPRISRAIAWIRSRLNAPISLPEAAAVAHLSPGRFRHLFVAQTGISFRGYLLWARVAAAVGAAMGGQSWTDAAQAWAFSDSAHLSRTCRRMFGIAPTMLVRE
jgi:AraC-like DNA-binding protein